MIKSTDMRRRTTKEAKGTELAVSSEGIAKHMIYCGLGGKVPDDRTLEDYLDYKYNSSNSFDDFLR